MPEPPASFVCAICERRWSNRFPGGPAMWPVPPVCRGCTQHWGKPATPPRTKVAGTLRDRAVLATLAALAEALESAARHRHFRETGHALEGL